MEWNSKYSIADGVRLRRAKGGSVICHVVWGIRVLIPKGLAEIVSIFDQPRTLEEAFASIQKKRKRSLKISRNEFLSGIRQLVSFRILSMAPWFYGAHSYSPPPKSVLWTRREMLVYRNPSMNSYGQERVEIGKYCSIADCVQFFLPSSNHNTHCVTTFPLYENVEQRDKLKLSMIRRYNLGSDPGKIIVKNDVWIGTGASIIGKITIGNGAIISANSNVVSDVPDYALVGGNPARVIRFRFPKTIVKKLLAIKWWDWREEKIYKNLDLFYGNPIAFVSKHFRPSK